MTRGRWGAGAGAALLLVAWAPASGCVPLCLEFGHADRGFSAEGDVYEFTAGVGLVLQEPLGDTWRRVGDRLERNGVEVREFARNVDTITLVDGRAATVEGRPPRLFLPADAAPEPVPDAPRATQAAALAGTEDTLWVAGLGPETDGSFAPWVTTRVGAVWRMDTPPDLAATSAGVVLAAAADRVAMVTENEGAWRLAERVDGGWGAPTELDAAEVGAAVYGGDGQLWVLAVRDVHGMGDLGLEGLGIAGAVVAIRPGGCEVELGDLAWPAALEATADGAAVLGITVEGEVDRFDLSEACALSSRTLAAPVARGFEGTSAAVNGEAAFLAGTWWVGRDGGGFSNPQYECY